MTRYTFANLRNDLEDINNKLEITDISDRYVVTLAPKNKYQLLMVNSLVNDCEGVVLKTGSPKECFEALQLRLGTSKADLRVNAINKANWQAFNLGLDAHDAWDLEEEAVRYLEY